MGDERRLKGERTVALVDDVLEMLPHLTGDELRRVAEAMPRVAGEWDWSEGRRWVLRPMSDGLGDAACVEIFANGWEAADAGQDGSQWTPERPCHAQTGEGKAAERSWHETPRAAQAACDARLRAAGVALCGEVVSDG